MGFEDEKIIVLRNEEVKKKYNSIETGVYIGNELVHFKEFMLFNDRAKIKLPDIMSEMPLDLASIKYPSEKRPQEIFSTFDGTANFTFAFNENNPASESDLEKIKISCKSSILKCQPANVFYNDSMIDVKNGKIYLFDFKSYALDTPIYNLLFLTCVDNILLLGTFNCQITDSNNWNQAVMLSLSSTDDLTKERNNENER